MNTATDQILLERFSRVRDGDAFSVLVRRHAGLVYGACLRACRDRTAAEDATQECFIELARQAHRIHTSLPAWLLTVARRTAARLRPRSSVPLADIGSGERGGDEFLEELDQALIELPDDTRALLMARYVEGLDQQRLAERFAVSQATVSRRLEDGLSRLRRNLVGDSAGCAAALAGLSIDVPASMTSKLDQTIARAPSLAKSSVAAMKTLIGAAISAAIAVAALTLWKKDPRPSPPPAPAAQGDTVAKAPDLLAAPVTVSVKNWPLSDIVDLIREQLPAGAAIIMVPDEACTRVTFVVSEGPAQGVVENITHAIGWHSHRIGDTLVLDHNVDIAGEPDPDKAIAAKYMAGCGSLEMAAQAISAWGNHRLHDDLAATNPAAERDYQRAILHGLAYLGGSTHVWSPVQSPLVLFSQNAPVVAAVAHSWRRAVDHRLGITPFFCHLVSVLGIHDLEDDLLQVVEDPSRLAPDFAGPSHFEELYRSRLRQAALVALGRLKSKRALPLFESILTSGENPDLTTAALDAIAFARNTDQRSFVEGLPAPVGQPWATVSSYYSALALLAPETLAKQAHQATEGGGFNPWNGFWDGFFWRPLPAFAATLLRAPSSQFNSGRWWMSGSLHRICAQPNEETLLALHQAFDRAADPAERTPSAAALAACCNRDALQWLIEAAETGAISWWKADSLASFAVSRAELSWSRPMLEALRDRIEAGNVKPAALSLLYPVRKERTIAAVIDAIPTMSAMDAAGAARFLVLDGSDTSFKWLASHLSVWSSICDERLLVDPRLRALVAEAAAATPSPGIDAGGLAHYGDCVDQAVARLAKLPLDQITIDLAHDLGPLFGRDLKPPLVSVPLVRILARWLIETPDPLVRQQCLAELDDWASLLGGEGEALVLTAIADGMKHETDPTVMPHLVHSAQVQQLRRGQVDDYEIFEESLLLLGGFDDPAVMRKLAEADAALNEALAAPSEAPNGSSF